MAADEQLRSEYERMKRIKNAYTVLMVDIALSENVNETYGHAVGDEVLKLLAHTMNKCLRPYDFIARFGGEEFTFAVA
jgi:two-component system, cell cycle response regulator